MVSRAIKIVFYCLAKVIIVVKNRVSVPKARQNQTGQVSDIVSFVGFTAAFRKKRRSLIT